MLYLGIYFLTTKALVKRLPRYITDDWLVFVTEQKVSILFVSRKAKTDRRTKRLLVVILIDNFY